MSASSAPPSAPPPGAAAPAILAQRRWRVSLLLAGVGDSIHGLLPLFALVALGQSITVSAAVGGAYVLGALLGNALLWGRLGDRVRSPLALVVVGTTVQGAAIVGLGLFPEIAGIVALAAGLGFVAVSMDGALMRLITGTLPVRERTEAAVLAASLLERGVLLGFALAAGVLPLLALTTSSRRCC